jgi:hypothetical protein
VVCSQGKRTETYRAATSNKNDDDHEKQPLKPVEEADADENLQTPLDETQLQVATL